MIVLDLSILNQKGTPMFNSDLTANRPAAGIVGRIFIAIDSPYGIFRDTGTSWDQVSSAGGGATLYSGDGTLSGNRIVSSGGFNLTFAPQTTFSSSLTAATGGSSYSVLGSNALSYAAGFSSSNIGNVYGANGAINSQTFLGNATFAQANLASAMVNVNKIDFSSAGGDTITMTQSAAPGIRAMTGVQNQIQFTGTHNGTITHAAISQNLGFFRETGSTKILTITNAYSLLLNPLDDYGAGFTFTNRWGIYQAGVNDKNFFAAASTFGERLNIESDSTITTQVSSAIVSTTTNANLVISPNGTGSLLASIPDGTLTGGNARGVSSVDLQTIRTANTQVSSGANATIVGGQNNTSSGNNSISGGIGNTASGQRSVAFGDSNVSSQTSAFAAGVGNTSSGSVSFSGGNGNTSSGETSTTFGRNNTNSGLRNLVSGNDHTNLGSWCLVSGQEHRNETDYNYITGRRGYGYLVGSIVQSYTNANIGITRGPLQSQSLIASRFISLASTATTNLSLDGTGITNLIIPYYQATVSPYRSWNVKVSTIVVVESISGTATGVSVGDSFMENRNVLFKRMLGTSSLVGSGVAEIISNASMSTAFMSYSAGASQELALTFNAPTFAGGGSVLFRIVSNVELVEVAI
jgi:hypothetical protein